MKKVKMFLGIMSLSMLFGCATNTDKNPSEMESEVSVLQESNLIDGTYYIWHKDNTCEPVYFGNATFEEGSIKKYPDNSRIMWYKEDFEEIPVLARGDKLIYYTKELLNENFIFERFEDFEYSIGICGMEVTESGRFSISTQIDDCCTYPGGDTDELLKIENKLVILDTLGGNQIRAVEDENGNYSYLTRCGTITGLKQGASYEAEIYEGTIKHEYIFTADVRILGSMEVTETVGYEFESDTIINIELPEFFNAGYYMINGSGIFKYLDNMDGEPSSGFNKMNEIKIDDESKNQDVVSSNQIDNITPKEPELEAETEKGFVSSFEVTGTGILTIDVTFKINSANSGIGDGLSDVSAVITTPSGKTIAMKETATGLGLTFNADETGIYTITYMDLDIRIPEVTITAGGNTNGIR